MAHLDTEAAADDAQRLVLHLVQSLVDTPSEVTVHQIPTDNGTLLMVMVRDGERRQVTGPKGRTAIAIRVILSAYSIKSCHGHRFTLEIFDPDGAAVN